MNRILNELLESYVVGNPVDNDSAAHGFLEYVLSEGHPLSEFSQQDMLEVAARFGLDEAHAMDLLEDAAMWLT